MPPGISVWLSFEASIIMMGRRRRHVSNQTAHARSIQRSGVAAAVHDADGVNVFAKTNVVSPVETPPSFLNFARHHERMLELRKRLLRVCGIDKRITASTISGVCAESAGTSDTMTSPLF